jgi:aminopeptidase N
MKKATLFFITLFITQLINAQEHACAKAKRSALAGRISMQARPAAVNALISHELKYDVKFVHLNLNVERNTKYISGNVKTVATVTASPLDTFMTLLHQNHIIDSIRFNGALLPAVRIDSVVKVKVPAPLPVGSSFTVIVYYKGNPPVGGSAIGSGFSTGTSGAWNNQATWSLSEAIVAYHWWPCKQILTDKIDSSWVFVTTDSLNKAGSNGRLQNVVIVGNKKRYEWKSRAPIDYYLISVAVAKYKEYNLYARPLYLPNDSILIQNYIYDNAINNSNWISQKAELNKMPQVMKLLCNLYGMYPFYKEKYGHCMAPFGGGMEHQTMTSLGFFDYYVDAHELGHQWWGDNVTCKSWGDIWINEGFAAYTEHLTAYYLDPSNFASNLSAAHNNVMNVAGGSVFFTNHDTLNSNVIFDSRLTYDKGGSIIRSLQFVTNDDSLWFNTLRGFQQQYKNSTASVIDFKNYYEAQTNSNATQFFNQWYYGEGYPTFNVTYNYTGSQVFVRSEQATSMPFVTPLFVTPAEYKISRSGKPDTLVRMLHTQPLVTFTLPLTGTVTGVFFDPSNWIINKTMGPARDATLGIIPGDPNGIATITNAAEITIGPNPVKSILLINAGNLPGKVNVYDLAGKLIVGKPLSENVLIDLGTVAPAVYVVKVYDSSGNEIRSRKIIKE